MKNTSMWAVLLGFVAFAIVICIDTNHWDWLSVLAGVAAVWCIAGWYWLNRKVFASDLQILLNCSSPMKCQWIGTFIFFAFIVLLVILILIWLLYVFGAWLLSIF